MGDEAYVLVNLMDPFYECSMLENMTKEAIIAFSKHLLPVAKSLTSASNQLMQ